MSNHFCNRLNRYHLYQWDWDEHLMWRNLHSFALALHQYNIQLNHNLRSKFLHNWIFNFRNDLESGAHPQSEGKEICLYFFFPALISEQSQANLLSIVHRIYRHLEIHDNPPTLFRSAISHLTHLLSSILLAWPILYPF